MEPKWSLTAPSVWRAFRLSGRKYLLITGGRDQTAQRTLLSQLPLDARNAALPLGARWREESIAALVRREDLPAVQGILPREEVFLLDVDEPFGRLGCVILASGMGNRFGGNKLLATFRGEPLILPALRATEGIFLRRVVVTRHEEVAALCRERGIETVLHRKPLRSDTVRLGLAAVGEVSGCLFCPGDQPLLRRETVETLALCAGEDPDSLWRPAYEGTPGAPVLFPSWTFPELNQLPEGCGGSYVVRKYPDRLRLLPISDGRELQDVDTPEELLALEA